MNSSASSPTVPVAIIGMGCMFPQAEDLARYWALIRDRVDAITEVPESHWRIADYHDPDPRAADRTYARRGGFLAPVDFPLLEFGIAPHSLEATDTTQLLGLMVARAALEDAGYPDSRSFDRDNVSVILGVSGTLELVIPLGARLGQPIWRRALEAAGVDGPTAEDVVRRIAASYVGWQEGSFPGLLGNVAAGRIANRLDLRGTNCVVDAACASSLGALELALLELAAGRCDLAVTGGIDTFNDIFVYMCFSKTPALSPTGDARPFDAAADGTILGEGLGLLVLKRLDDARRDGDRIYAVIRSVGSSSDGKGQAVYAPSAAGQVRALARAYELAGVAPESVELVEAHGTGTKVGDATELQALEEVYQTAARPTPWCAVGSVKSQVGHTKAAAGAAGLIKAALSLHHKVLPPTAKIQRPVERLANGSSPFYVSSEARPWLTASHGPRRAAVSAFGFGGSNFHCILEEASPDKALIDWDGDVQILAFSADRPDQIIQALEPWPSRGDWSEIRREAALGRARFRTGHHCRMLLVVQRAKTDLATACALARARLEASSAADSALAPTAHEPGQSAGDQPRVFLGLGPRPGELAMLFPGQGSQYTGMLRELACRFPRMHRALGLANELSGRSGALLSDHIFPRTTFRDEDRARQELALRDTRLAQPAIGAVAVGLLEILEDLGVRADCVAGHSFGELTALRAAGRIDDRSLLQLALTRGALMSRQTEGEDQGAMLAVLAPYDEVAAALREHHINLVIANKNAPRQHVLSGSTAQINRAASILRDRQIATLPIPVAAAFHSQFVASAEEPLYRALQSIPIAPSTIPVFANTTAAPYPADPAGVRVLLAGQLARPVEFVAQIEAMYQMGARTFLEVGPDARLTALVRAILAGRESWSALAVDASRGASGNLFDLACSLASLAALGYAVDLDRWDDTDHGRAPAGTKTGLTARICGANLRPRDRIETDRPMNQPDGTSPHEVNGEAASHDNAPGTVSPRSADPDPGRQPPIPPPNAVPGEWLAALKETRQSLLALERLAAQTADLHREFLEGQERTQQTFLKLLEHEQRLSRALIGWPPASTPELSTAPVLPPQGLRAHPEAGAPAEQRPAPPETLEQSTSPPMGLIVGRPTSATNGQRKNGPLLSEDSPTPPKRQAILRDGLTVPPQRRSPDSGGLPTPPERMTESLLLPHGETPAPGTLAAILIDVVAEKTGYPAEVLDFDMQLDSDLGIDSIKRVEILSALQDRIPGLSPLEPERLGSFRTLRAIAEHLVASEPGTLRAAPSEHGPRPAGQSASGGEFERVLLETVAEKTGYPVDILELGMRLDTDLGIDSIKRVEIFSAIQDRLPAAPAAAPDQMNGLATLGEIARFLASQPDHRAPLEVAATAVCPRADSFGGMRPRSAEANGHPVDRTAVDLLMGTDHGTDTNLRRLELRVRPLEDHEARDAIVLPSGGIIRIAADDPPLARALQSEILSRGYACQVVPLDEAARSETTGALCALIIVAPADLHDQEFAAKAFRALRASGRALEQSAARGASALVTVARLGGSFGLAGVGCGSSPISGALAGMAKTAAREWPGVNCKALDLDPGFEPAEEAARWIAEEMLRRGPAEVGLSRAGRTWIELEPISVHGANGCASPALDRGDLVVISGGARGITAEAAVALAEVFQPRLVLLGRSPEPAEEPGWLAGLRDETELKRGLLERSQRRLTPQELKSDARRIIAQREIRNNLARIAKTGSPVVYRSLDVRDRESVRATLAQIRREFGPVRGLVHGSGILADRRITEQTDEQFALVFDTKVKGIHHLFEAIEPDSLRFLALFSSSSARFGRSGQVAYSAANEYLNKWAQAQAARMPRCRVVSFNWGPWAGGMVQGALKPLFEKEGLSLIPPGKGARLVADFAAGAGGRSVEVVVLAESRHAPEIPAGKPAASDRIPRCEGMARVFRRSVDLESIPVLATHVIDGHAVLPVALILEWMAEGAVHRNPGLAVCGVDDFHLYKGLILGDGRGPAVELCAGRAVRTGEEFVVPVELRGTLASGREVAHARASIVLADRHAVGSRRILDQPLPLYPRSPSAIYQSVLFHGPAMQAIESVEGCGERAIAGWVKTAPDPADWIDQPVRNNWLIDPLTLDGAFQLVGLWTREQLGSNSLPTGLGGFRQFRRDDPTGAVRVLVEIQSSNRSRALADIEILDDRGGLVARLDEFECVVDSSLNNAFRRNRLPSVVSAVSS